MAISCCKTGLRWFWALIWWLKYWLTAKYNTSAIRQVLAPKKNKETLFWRSLRIHAMAEDLYLTWCKTLKANPSAVRIFSPTDQSYAPVYVGYIIIPGQDVNLSRLVPMLIVGVIQELKLPPPERTSISYSTVSDEPQNNCICLDMLS